ncbi:MAG: hypothetical protein QOI14_1073 [Actinomycetota bacterium]|nr:hypothetical protein [Actinomycetota bacterium]
MASSKQMDIDALTTARREDWQRLAALAQQGKLSGPEADELIQRYQAGASDLSAIRTTVGQTGHGDGLSLSLSRARLRFTGTSTNVLEQLPRFFANQLPAALYRIRWLTLAVTAACALIAVISGLYFNANPQLLLHLGTAAELRKYASQEFVGYYSAHSTGAFAGQVWTNNAWIAAQAILTGITGIYPATILIQNSISLGQAGAIMNQYGRIDHFWLYIAPHGQLELYSIFTAGAAGLMLFWAWVAPGRRTRIQALAQDGRALFTIVVGLIISLAVSGTIEGFVTRQPWPWPIKIAIGTVALLAFLSYQWIIGRRATRGGETGDLEEFEGGAREIVAA